MKKIPKSPKAILTVWTLAVLIFSCQTMPQAPNIILVITDDQGYADISAHGSPDVRTPSMDLLKSQSISLKDFQVSPTCAPTRAAIMSGKHPFKCGITHTILERERMAPGITTLPEVLKRQGYTSGIFGKWHLGDEDPYQPGNRGFDEVFIHGGGGIGQAYPGSCADAPGNGYFAPVIRHNDVFVKTKGFCTDVFFAQALTWIREQSEADQPFFAYISSNAPHSPYIAPEDYKKKFIEKAYSKKTQGYYGMIENIDDNLGVLMQKLEAWGISENTVLIFMSDNGKAGVGKSSADGTCYNAGMKGFKGSVDEGGTRVPFFIRWPGVFMEGTEIDVLLNHYDILPTIADIADADLSDLTELDGQSFLPNLKDPSLRNDDRLRFFHKGRWPLNPANVNGREIANKKFLGTAESSDPDSSKYRNYAVRNEQYRFVNNQELYDLSRDPGQENNIAELHPELVSMLRAAYEQWWEELRPLMVNEDALLAEEKPFWVSYREQKNSSGIKEWEEPDIE